MNKKIIIAILIVILIVIVGIFAFNAGKTDTQLNFLTGNSLKNGDAVQFVLTDAQGNVLSNQNVTITFESNGQSQNYTITTNSEGKGSLILNNEELGEHNITVTYNGDSSYNGCSASQIITIEEGESESSDYTDADSSATSNDNSTSDSSSDLNYDSELNVHYDNNGKVVGGQNDGADYNDLKNNPPQVDENGNLI